MQKIINGLLYDTDTAELIHISENKRRLYRTAKGNFFIVYPNGTIEPKSEENVKILLGQSGLKKDIETYIELFNEPDLA